ALAACEIERLFFLADRLPLIIARRRDQAPRVLERGSKKRPLGGRFGAGVERREPQFLERLFPPTRHQPPAHRDQLALGAALKPRINQDSAPPLVALALRLSDDWSGLGRFHA